MSFICGSMTMRGSTCSNFGQIVGQGGANFAYRSQELGHGSGSSGLHCHKDGFSFLGDVQGQGLSGSFAKP